MSKTTELSNAKRALLEKYLCGDLPQAATAVETIPRRSLRGPAPLAFGQEQLWFLAQVMPASPAFHESFPMSLNEFIKRHEIWRTSFPAIDGQPAQVIHSVSHVKLSVVDLRNVPVTEREGEALQLATEEAIQPCDRVHGPLLRAPLVRLDDNTYRLSMTLHHMIVNAISIHQIFLPELYTLYEAFSKGKPSLLSSLPIQYADFASWARESLPKDTFAKHVAYWKQQLANAPPVLDVPTDRPRPPVQSYRGLRQTFIPPICLMAQPSAVWLGIGRHYWKGLLPILHSVLRNGLSCLRRSGACCWWSGTIPQPVIRKISIFTSWLNLRSNELLMRWLRFARRNACPIINSTGEPITLRIICRC